MDTIQLTSIFCFHFSYMKIARLNLICNLSISFFPFSSIHYLEKNEIYLRHLAGYPSIAAFYQNMKMENYLYWDSLSLSDNNVINIVWAKNKHEI